MRNLDKDIITEEVICEQCGNEYSQRFKIEPYNDYTPCRNTPKQYVGGGCFYKGKQLCDRCCAGIEAQ